MKTTLTTVALTFVLVIGSAEVKAASTDARIESTAKKTYVYQTCLKDDDIVIKSRNGIVTLTGTVSEMSHKTLAEDTVKTLPGVNGVENQLKVKAPEPARNSDDWVAAKVKLALLFHRNVKGNTQVTVKDGVVTLGGPAESQAQKELTAEYAKDVEGVKDVVNQMTVVPATKRETLREKIDDASITAQVKFTLLSHRSTSALRTEVDTKDGIVTVRGMAKNQAEMDLVSKLVKDIDGVKDVKNEMKVQG